MSYLLIMFLGVGIRVQVVILGFSWGMGMDPLIRMNPRVLGGWFGIKISAGQSGGVSLLGQLGPFHFSLILKVFIYSCLYFLMH